MPYSGDVLLRLHKDIRSHGGFGPCDVVSLQRVIPGLPEGARLWVNYFRRLMTETLDYKEVYTGVFKLGKESVMSFMDDLLINSPKIKDTYDSIKEYVTLDGLESGWPTKYVGISYTLDSEELLLSMAAYLDSLDESCFAARGLTAHAVSQLGALDDEQHDVPPPAVTLLKEAMGYDGKLDWLSQGVPQLKMLHSLCASRMHKFPQEAINVCKRAFTYHRSNHSAIVLKKFVLKPQLRIWADASFNSSKLKAVLGIALQVVGADDPIQSRHSVFFTRSVRLKRLCRSTFMAELEASAHGLAAGIMVSKAIGAL